MASISRAPDRSQRFRTFPWTAIAALSRSYVSPSCSCNSNTSCGSADSTLEAILQGQARLSSRDLPPSSSRREPPDAGLRTHWSTRSRRSVSYTSHPQDLVMLMKPHRDCKLWQRGAKNSSSTPPQLAQRTVVTRDQRCHPPTDDQIPVTAAPLRPGVIAAPLYPKAWRNAAGLPPATGKWWQSIERPRRLAGAIRLHERTVGCGRGKAPALPGDGCRPRSGLKHGRELDTRRIIGITRSP